MSLRAISIVLERSRHPGTKKLVLLALADRSDENGESCYPGYEWIAARSNCSVRRVIDLVAELEAEGVIAVTRDARPGRSLTNSYSLRVWLEYQEAMIGKKSSMGEGAARVNDSGERSRGPSTPQGSAQDDNREKGEKIAGVKRLHPSGAGEGEKGEIQREKGEIGEPERVKSSAAGFHPIRQDTLEEKKRESAPSPAQAAPAPPAPPGGEEGGAVAKLLADEWRRWDGHLEELGARRTRATMEAEKMNAARYPDARVVEVIRFSILKGAKNLLFEVKRGEMPRHLWCEEGDGVQGSGFRVQSAPQIPGWAAWLSREFGEGWGSVTWETMSVEHRKKFAREHPHLRFRGLVLQIFEGETASRSLAEGRAA